MGALRLRWLFTLLPRTLTYFFNQSVPWLYKLILLLPVLWYFTPIARIANTLPVVGLLDLATILLITLALFTSLSGRYLQRKVQRTAATSPDDSSPTTYVRTQPLEIIEGEYYVIDRSQTQPQTFKKAS